MSHLRRFSDMIM